MLITICISSTIKRRICLAKSGTTFAQFVQLFAFTFDAISFFGQQTFILTAFIICQTICSLKIINDKKKQTDTKSLRHSFSSNKSHHPSNSFLGNIGDH